MIYYIILILIKISLLISLCKEGEKNCLKYNPITKLCYKCENILYTSNENGGCDMIPKCKPNYNNCLQCQENKNKNICIKCEKGYFPDEMGGCSYSKNCILSNNGNCLKCKENYVLIGQNTRICKSINSEDLKNCKDINLDNGLCSNCTEDFYLNSIDQKCSRTENCSESLYGICKKCNKGYYLDKKEKTCKMQNNTFINCKESITGEKCDICDENYYFDEEEKCIPINYCYLGDKKNINICKKCYEGYYLTEFKDCCTKDINCYEGDKNIGICLRCKEGYYIDFNDGKCKLNTENNEYKNCRIADNNKCTNCLYGFTLAEDLKCSSANNCEEVEDGKCIRCINNYYLGLDDKCSNIENCIYSNNFGECIECKDNYYYNRKKWKCEIGTGIFKGCRYGYDDWRCFACKNNYYLNQTDSLCYSNEEIGDFYKCSMTDFNATYCARCIDNYNLGEIDHKCTLLKGCELVNEDGKCIECDEDYCLDINLGICEYNYEIKNKEKKFYFRCIRTNKEGNACEICDNRFILSNNGLCVNMNNCIEKSNDGTCKKCQINENGYYCLSHDFGCIETYFDDCMECDDILDFDKCTKCIDGYEIGEYNLCYVIEDN